MSDDELYELARNRINRRTRRFLLLGVNFFAFLLFVAAYAGLGIVPSNVGKFITLVWMGVFILHVILLGVTQYRKEAIESEVAKLRELMYDEKPKRDDVTSRLRINDDGELIDFDEPYISDAARKDSLL